MTEQINTLAHTFKILGLPNPDGMENKILGLQRALRNMALNRRHWFRPDDVGSRLVLQSHGCFTLMAPAGKASRARQGVEELRKAGLGTGRGFNRETVFGVIKPYCRFPNQKAERVSELLQRWGSLFGVGPQGETPYIVSLHSSESIRDYLITTVNGFGKKAASHFMRNTGLMSGWTATTQGAGHPILFTFY